MLSSEEVKESLSEIYERIWWMQENVDDAGERFMWICNELGVAPDDCVELIDSLIKKFEGSTERNITHLVTATLWHGISLGRAAERGEHSVK